MMPMCLSRRCKNEAIDITPIVEHSEFRASHMRAVPSEVRQVARGDAGEREIGADAERLAVGGRKTIGEEDGAGVAEGEKAGIECRVEVSGKQ